jgi:hypothetical protein
MGWVHEQVDATVWMCELPTPGQRQQQPVSFWSVLCRSQQVSTTSMSEWEMRATVMRSATRYLDSIAAIARE